MTRRALFTLITPIILLSAVLAGAAYDRGVEDGMRDLCGEMGGTWDNSEHGWCDAP